MPKKEMKTEISILRKKSPAISADIGLNGENSITVADLQGV
ncbi:MAG: hypothetical protein ACI4IF_07275 [Acutalibacteraceae bacterium]